MSLTEINEAFTTEALQRRILNCDTGSHKLFDIEKTFKLTKNPAQIEMLSKKNQFASEFEKAKRLERLAKQKKVI